MTSRHDKQEAERAVFRDFAETAGLPVTSIGSRQPPEPDILCNIVGEGHVAFELGQVVGEELERAVSEQRAARRQFRSAYAALPRDDRERIESQLGGPPAVFVGFAPKTPPGQWRHAISPILAFLVDRAKSGLSAGLCAGDVGAQQLLTLAPAHVTDLSIRRATTTKVFFGVTEAVEVADATRRMLAKKLGGSYVSAAPMELLLYWTAAPAPRTIAWRQGLLADIRARRSASTFRRVWCFDFFERAVVIVDPERAD